tara:strand:+ start:99 stop:443 length:345 start_codon:yes stop_codon:yes gene_type:complete
LLFFFNFNISNFINFKIKEVGVITIKKIAPITNGEIILPNNIPNLNHILFNGDKRKEFVKPKIKKIKLINKDHNLILFPLNKGNNAIMKKRIEKTIPKLLSDPILISLLTIFKF